MVNPSSLSSLPSLPSSQLLNGVKGQINLNSMKNKLSSTISPMGSEDKKKSKLGSLYIYFKLFFFYPAKYLFLLYIFILICYLLNEAYKYGKKSYYKIANFLKVLIVCSQMKKCSKKNKGSNCCELNLIVFNVPDVFKLFMGILDLLLGVIYAFVTLFIILAAALCIVPFSIMLPYYRALI